RPTRRTGEANTPRRGPALLTRRASPSLQAESRNARSMSRKRLAGASGYQDVITARRRSRGSPQVGDEFGHCRGTITRETAQRCQASTGVLGILPAVFERYLPT